MKVKVVDKRSVKLEDLDKEDYIPFLEGRPSRNEAINEDDIMNLQIALNTSKNFKEFIRKV